MCRRVNAAPVHCQLCVLLILGCGKAFADNQQPSLLTLSKELECAVSMEQASELLGKFHNIALPKLPLPNEWFSTDKPPSLHAASLDIALNTLTSASKRYPELAMDVEEVILQWSYCEVLLDNTFYDFVGEGEKLEKKIAHVLSPIQWQGFHAMGFLGDHDGRFVIDAFKHDDAPFVFYEVDFSTLFRRQCLPHPQTSELYYSSDTYFPWRIVQNGYQRTKKYPYSWEAGCHAAVDEVVLAENDVVDDVPTESVDKVEIAKTDSTESPVAESDSSKPKSVELKTVEAESTEAESTDAESTDAESTDAESIAPESSDEESAEVESSVLKQPDAGSSDSELPAEESQLNVADIERQVDTEVGDRLTETEPPAPAAAEAAAFPPVQQGTSSRFASVEELAEALEVAGAVAFAGVSQTEYATSLYPEPENTKKAEQFLPAQSTYDDLDASDGATDDSYLLDTPLRHQLSEAEKKQLIARRLIGYRYELIEKQKSLANISSGPGYSYFKTALRPVALADGIADYAMGQKRTSSLVDGIADYIDHKPLPERFEAVNTIASSTASPYSLITSDSKLGKRWIDDVMFRDRNHRRPAPDQRSDSKHRSKKRKVKPLPGVLTAMTIQPVIVDEGERAPVIVIDAVPETKSEVNGPQQVKTKPKKKYRGFNGFITLGNRSFESDGFSLTTGASYKPIKDSYWFIRSSWNYRLDDEEFRYTWGIGYDDWHPGTFAAQLNHWGPLLPGDYLDLDNAVASFTYKFNKNKFMKKNGVSSSITLSQKISGEPVFSWSNSWTPKGKWFVRSTLSQPVKGGDMSWSYGFGYANYAPFTFSFEYNNWGYNKAFEDNFKDNGTLSMTYRWRY